MSAKANNDGTEPPNKKATKTSSDNRIAKVISPVVHNLNVGSLKMDEDDVWRFLPNDSAFYFKEKAAEIINDLFLCFKCDEDFTAKLVLNIGKVHGRILEWADDPDFKKLEEGEVCIGFAFLINSTLLSFENEDDAEEKVDLWDDETKSYAKAIYFRQWGKLKDPNSGDIYQQRMTNQYPKIILLLHKYEKSITKASVDEKHQLAELNGGNFGMDYYLYKEIAQNQKWKEFHNLVGGFKDEKFVKYQPR